MISVYIENLGSLTLNDPEQLTDAAETDEEEAPQTRATEILQQPFEAKNKASLLSTEGFLSAGYFTGGEIGLIARLLYLVRIYEATDDDITVKCYVNYNSQERGLQIISETDKIEVPLPDVCAPLYIMKAIIEAIELLSDN